MYQAQFILHAWELARTTPCPHGADVQWRWEAQDNTQGNQWPRQWKVQEINKVDCSGPGAVVGPEKGRPLLWEEGAPDQGDQEQPEKSGPDRATRDVKPSTASGEEGAALGMCEGGSHGWGRWAWELGQAAGRGGMPETGLAPHSQDSGGLLSQE